MVVMTSATTIGGCLHVVLIHRCKDNDSDSDYNSFNRNAPSANGWSARGFCKQTHKEETTIIKKEGKICNYQM